MEMWITNTLRTLRSKSLKLRSNKQVNVKTRGLLSLVKFLRFLGRRLETHIFPRIVSRFSETYISQNNIKKKIKMKNTPQNGERQLWNGAKLL